MCDGPPCMQRKMTRFARGGKCGARGASGLRLSAAAASAGEALEGEPAEAGGDGAEQVAAGEHARASRRGIRRVRWFMAVISGGSGIRRMAKSAWQKVDHESSAASSVCCRLFTGMQRRRPSLEQILLGARALGVGRRAAERELVGERDALRMRRAASARMRFAIAADCVADEVVVHQVERLRRARSSRRARRRRGSARRSRRRRAPRARSRGRSADRRCACWTRDR